MDEIIQRLRSAQPHTNFGSTICAADAWAAGDEIESLRAENARLTEERDALVEAVEAAIACGMVPKSSAREGGAVKHVVAAQVADMLRDALAKVKREPYETSGWSEVMEQSDGR